nr:MAG TPA: hypothetical protein [Caudoviricetes sp.]
MQLSNGLIIIHIIRKSQKLQLLIRHFLIDR